MEADAHRGNAVFPTCERCQTNEGVASTVVTGLVVYWHCNKCGHLWITEKSALSDDVLTVLSPVRE